MAGSNSILIDSICPVLPLLTCSYDGLSVLPPVKPDVTEVTPFNDLNIASVHQKQPPPKTAISVLFWDILRIRASLVYLCSFACKRTHLAARRLAVFLERDECAWTDALFAMIDTVYRYFCYNQLSCPQKLSFGSAYSWAERSVAMSRLFGAPVFFHSHRSSAIP